MTTEKCEHGVIDQSKGTLTYGECVNCNEMVMTHKFNKKSEEFEEV